MQKLFLALLLSSLLISCSQKELIVPEVGLTSPPVKETQAFYKDPNILIKEVSATQTASGQVAFQFSTEYEKNLKSIEVYSGASNALLCEIYAVSRGGSSEVIKSYSLVEKNIQSNVNYYMIKYTTVNNEWSVSPLFKVELK
jgi:hypothetical protein